MIKMLDEEKINQLEEISKETQVSVKGRDFKVAREVLPFDKLMEVSAVLSKSTIIPILYQNRVENCFIALDMASRMGISPMLLMQNLYIINAKPSMSGQFIASLIRSSDQFKNVELNYVGTPNTDSWGAFITATKTNTGTPVKGATVTISIAKKEGWYTKTGSKWQTTPELMLAYRAYTWFGRVHAPELLMGLSSADEIEDVDIQVIEVTNPYEDGGL